jgi:hypothetical protein
VFDRIIKRIQEKVQTREYIISLHADDEMDDDDLEVYDVEHALRTGSIIERQKDRDTHEWKYLVSGQTSDGTRDIVVVVKFSPTGKLIWVTVYEE